MARLVQASDKDCLALASQHLRDGKLVAFPTETVYGLGANALDERAVLSIFEAKQRPLTDPVIVHVAHPAQALPLLALPTPALRKVFDCVAAAFWPGPLTVVGRAAEHVPAVVCANTGFVGVRCPSHPFARALLEHSSLHIAAPSANRFGHVSPTTAQHVLADLGHLPNVVVVDGGGCDVGVESTVVKLDVPHDKAHGAGGDTVELTVLRRGAVTPGMLAQAVKGVEGVQCSVVGKDVGGDSRGGKALSSCKPDEPQVAPGQLLKHYAPEHPTFLVSHRPPPPAPHHAAPCVRACAMEEAMLGGMAVRDGVAGPAQQPPPAPSESITSGEFPLSAAVVVDFGGSLGDAVRGRCAAYRDLSPGADFDEAARTLFDVLRWTEGVQGAKCVVLCDVLREDGGAGQELAPAVYDRMFRAASGSFAVIQ